ncbi:MULTISPECIES: hypothetical protein [Halorussus]|uniref:hypothetical protein n=1 Tax=Halorussus TaxID=1070314 RepID=UPI000E2196EB|nr:MULTISPECIES: hypothetical protein [Halorussus]NHN59314.1 hypothetical protein [Halorussus sp. JP-T4]
MANELSASETTPAQDADAADVEWSHTVAESRLLRALAGASFGVLAAMALAAGVAAVAFTAGSFLSGRYGIAVALLFALLFTAARIAPQITAFRTGTSDRLALLHGALHDSGWLGLAAATAFGAGVVWLGVRLGDIEFFLVVFGTIAVPMVAVSALTSEGELRSDAETLTYCGTDIDLSALDGVRRVGLGGLVVYRLSYVAGAMTPTTPRFLVVPAGVDDALRAALDAGVAADPPESDPTNPAIRATLAVFGVGLLAFAGLLLTVDPTGPTPRGGAVLVYAALMAGLFGAIFLSLARRSG